MFIKFFLSNIKDMVLESCNESMPCKNNDFMLSSAIKSIENITKKLFKYREGGRGRGGCYAPHFMM